MRHQVALLWCLVAVQAAAAPIIVDHTSVEQVSGMPAELTAKAARLAWFFAHASVGDNIMDGLTDLHNLDPARFPLQRQEYFGHDAPPSDISSGTVYDHMRWNPGWQTKIAMFETNVTQYWHDPRVQVVMNKLGYVDWEADLDVYLGSLAKLQAENPATLVVYLTMAVSGDGDRFEVQRSQFNDRLRAWVATNNAVLFDVADIECHSPRGDLSTFTYDGGIYPFLYAPYSIDGGHLNAPDNIGRQQVALGIYALSAALFTTDRNGDGISDGDSLLAGIPPLLPTTPTVKPEVRIVSAPATGRTLALLWALVNPKDQGEVAGYLEWSAEGISTRRQYFPPVANATNPVSFPLTIMGLTPGTTYTCQLVATNSAGLTLTAPTVFSTPTQSTVLAVPDWIDRPASSSVMFPVSQLLANDRGIAPLTLEWFSSTSTLGANLSIHRTTLLYVPPANADAIDTFFYLVSDASGAIDGAWATILPQPLNPSVSSYLRSIVGVQLAPSGSAVITGMGIPGQTYAIQTSASLTPPNWQTVSLVQASVSGLYTFEDSQPSTSATHYYRAVQP
jgi:hypothetical protein